MIRPRILFDYYHQETEIDDTDMLNAAGTKSLSAMTPLDTAPSGDGFTFVVNGIAVSSSVIPVIAFSYVVARQQSVDSHARPFCVKRSLPLHQVILVLI
jgi:hypothetical protein